MLSATSQAARWRGICRVRRARLLAGRHFGIVDRAGWPSGPRTRPRRPRRYAGPADRPGSRPTRTPRARPSCAALLPPAAEAAPRGHDPHLADPRRRAARLAGAGPRRDRPTAPVRCDPGHGRCPSSSSTPTSPSPCCAGWTPTRRRAARRCTTWSSWPASPPTWSAGDGCCRSCWPIRPRAVWRPVLTGPDAAWARVLAASMPPPAGGRAIPARALTVWADALDALVDAAARARSGPLGGLQHSVAPAIPAARAWLAALTGTDRTFAAEPAAVAALASAGRSLAGRRRRRPGAGVLPAGRAERRRRGLAGPVRAAGRRRAEPGRRRRRGLASRGQAAGAGPPGRRAAGDLPGRAGQGRPALPELDGALRTARPHGLALDTDGAHRFLSTAAPTLATAGFGVQLPGWWTRPSSRLGLRLTAATPAPARAGRPAVPTVGFDSIAEFRYDLAVGGEVLTADGAGRAGRAEGAAGAAARPVGRAGRAPAGGRAEAGRADRARPTVGELLRLGLGVDPARSTTGTCR